VISAWSAAGGQAGGSGTLSPQTVRYWTAIAKCETGGGGPPKWNWGSKHRPGEGSAFEGGLGFSADTWQRWAGELGLLRRYPHAYDAPRLVQIRAAVYGTKIHNARWGCMH
jgi:Transglycosylase-like domain